MTALVWDQPEDRVYEAGLDRGVLYLKDGTSVVWNGLTEVEDNTETSSTPYYFDGKKSIDFVDIGDFAATLKAFTYPEEFLRVEGIAEGEPGMLFAQQPRQRFGLSYRTYVATGVDTDLIDYKIHILYNLTATPSSKVYSTLSDEAEAIEFEWNLNAVPERFPYMRPTAHVIIDSRIFDPTKLTELEGVLYGTPTEDPYLIDPSDLVDMMNS